MRSSRPPRRPSSPKTWYGMPAYAKDGKVVCFFQSADKFKSRYATFGFERRREPRRRRHVADLLRADGADRRRRGADRRAREEGGELRTDLARRQPRSDPRAGRAREQPQGRQRRDPEAPADGVHRRLRLGQELAGVRHDRRGVAAADQRDLQRLRAGLHADAGAAGRRRARRADDGDHRRPGADGRQRPLHRRHRHRRQRDAAHPLQPARAAAHRLAQGVLVQRRRRSTASGAITVERGAGKTKTESATLQPSPAACARAARAWARSPTSTCPRCTTTASRSTRARSRSPATAWTAGTAASSAAPASSTRTSRSASTPRRELHDLLYKEPTKIKVDGINLTYEGLIPKIQKSLLSKDVDALQPHIRAFVERAVTFTDLPRVRRHPAQRGGPVVEDRGHQHRRRLRDADQRPGRVGAGPRRAVGGAAARGAAAHPRLVRRDRARLPLARPAVGHAVGRRGAAHQDDPPPRLVAHRRHLRLRRADDRAAPPRHPADERPAAAAARQGQHGARRGAQAGDDRDRRPRRRPRPRRRHRRRRGGVRGHRRGAAGQRHAHRPPPRRPGRR